MGERPLTRTPLRCVVCGETGTLWYRGMVDGLYGVPGNWAIARCQRAACGLCWLEPPQTAEDIERAYDRYYTHSSVAFAREARVQWYEALRERVWGDAYGSRTSPNNLPLAMRALTMIPPVREQLRFDRLFLEPAPGGRLLDVGCGSGDAVERLCQLGWDAQGIDPDPHAISAGLARGIRVQVGTLDSLDLPHRAFDAITLSHVIEHVPDPVATLRRCSDLLKDNGRLVLVTPNHESLCRRWFGRHWRGFEPPRHLQVFSVPSLRWALRQTDLTPVELRTSCRDASGMYCASYNLKHHGRHSHGSTPDRSVRLRGDVALLIECIATGFRFNAGEEIVCVARKGR